MFWLKVSITRSVNNWGKNHEGRSYLWPNTGLYNSHRHVHVTKTFQSLLSPGDVGYAWYYGFNPPRWPPLKDLLRIQTKFEPIGVNWKPALISLPSCCFHLSTGPFTDLLCDIWSAPGVAGRFSVQTHKVQGSCSGSSRLNSGQFIWCSKVLEP